MIPTHNIDITKRIPKIDWQKPFVRHWNDNNPPASHAFNALSFLFPEGEKFFMDSALEVAESFNFSHHSKLEKAVALFVAQEAIHSQQHSQYNEALVNAGYKNVVDNYVKRNIRIAHRLFSPMTKLALTSAYEHYTAILGDFILRNPNIFKAASDDMSLIWGWHAAEETEHKSVCFDLYQAAGGGWFRRILSFLYVSFDFWLTFSILFWNMLYKDGCLKFNTLPKTIKQFLHFFFGRCGVSWHVLRHGFSYLSPTFHPWKLNNYRELQHWLEKNKTRLNVLL